MSLTDVIGYFNLVAFAALGIIAIREWRRRRQRAAAWAAASFGALGIVVVLGQLVPDDPEGFVEIALQRVDIAVLVVFPYLLYRFTTAFRMAPRPLEWVVSLATAALVVWTFALPDVPESGEPRPAWFWAYLVAFLVHWTALSVVVAGRLWRAGRGQPSVARRRMRLLAFAAAALTLALFVAAVGGEPNSARQVVAALLATASALGFLLGIAPPEVVRMVWRRPETERLRNAMQELIAVARTPAEVVERVLPPIAEVVGARAVAFVDSDGEVVAAHGVDRADADRAARGEQPGLAADARLIRLDVNGNALLVWTSPYAPFFGAEELGLLRTLVTLTALAVDRARLFEHERSAREALEQASELKTNFVALAAHELRTPVTTIHGFATTLNRLGDRLGAAQQVELRHTLEREAARMAALVEQLLDLSRLDAEAVAIEPQRLAVRERVLELVRTAAAERIDDVAVQVPDELAVSADPDAFDRIVSNLVTNALRYGEAPVEITAEQRDTHFRLAVQDRGPGVPDAFVPLLFERFARSDESRARARGTGLGLAIARSYAHAHGGDLLYTPREPRGARFELILPTR